MDGQGAVTLGMQPGWYSDPTGRYEHRYFNGSTWSADVAVNGQRSVDPFGAAPNAGSGSGSGTTGTGLATAAMTLGIVGAGLGAIMVLFYVAAPIGLVAFVLGLVALPRARRSGMGTSQAWAGVILGPIAMILGGVGLALFWTDLRDAFREASDQLNRGAYTVDIGRCDPEEAEVVVDGTITNETSRTRTYRIRLEFFPDGGDAALGRAEVVVDQVAPDSTQTFATTAPIDVSNGVRCSVDRVIAE